MSLQVKITLWGTVVGYLAYPSDYDKNTVFEYDPSFLRSGIQISPIHLMHPPGIYTFPNLSFKSFHGLPGFISDSLPDNYGNQLIDMYMAQKNIPPDEVSALDRLLYVADRGMGALEYHPGEKLPLERKALDLAHLAELAEMVLHRKEELNAKLSSAGDRATALSMIRVGSSAGGARSKALLALSPKGTILDGTVNHGAGYSYWLLKFDSHGNRDLDRNDPKGMPVVEYIYSLIAGMAGIEMPRTKLIEDGKDRHFLIERFDRFINKGNKLDKLHYVSWAGMGHTDRDGVNSYEQLVLLLRQLGLGQDEVTRIFRRAVFNILGRNHDDHSKNFGFLMDRRGQWSLSPAFDMTYSYDPGGRWTKNHQSWLNGKNNDFNFNDLLSFASFCNLDERKARQIINQIKAAFQSFPRLAKEYEVDADLKKTIESNMRLGIVPG